MGGVLKADLRPLRAQPEAGHAQGRRFRPHSAAEPPLPARQRRWIYGGVSVSPMAKPARQRETLHSRAIYRFHPLFAEADFVAYYGDEDRTYQPATIEGGDVHVIGHSAVLIGMGERTTPMAIEMLAAALFDAGQATSVVAIELPHSHAFMHLDTVMSMVDVDTFVLNPTSTGNLRSLTVTEGDDQSSSPSPATTACGTPGADPRGRRGLRCSPPTRTSGPPNVSNGTTVALSRRGPGRGPRLIERNVAQTPCLRKHGIEVVSIAAASWSWSAARVGYAPHRARPGLGGEDDGNRFEAGAS